MPSQLRPEVSHSLSRLERCPPEILEQIALFAVEERFLGPPSDLLALLTTSKTVHFALSPENNNNLYARIFALKFDTAAASRRLARQWLTNRSLATELRLRFEALGRIRDGVIDGYMLQYDLWTVFFILLDHDHKNALQLTEWARSHTFAQAVAEHWLSGGYGPEFSENSGGLVCTIIWELVREADLTEVWQLKVQGLLHTHVLCGYRLSSFYASEEFFVVTRQLGGLEERIRGKPPTSTQAQYYGHPIAIAALPLTSACLSVYLMATLPNSFRYTPGYMEQYVPGRTFSERMDAEWYRLVMCHSTSSAPNPLSGNRLTPSALVGSWKGTVLAPLLAEFTGFLHSNQRQDPHSVQLRYFDAEMELREHHSFSDEMHLTAGRRLGEVGDDPLSAWIPQGTRFEEYNDRLEVHDPIKDRTVVYETYQADAEKPYASGYIPEIRWVSVDRAGPEEEELERLGSEIINREPDTPDETQGLVNNPQYIDNDEHWADVVKQPDFGIKDILITGRMKTGDRDHQVVGRIRAWDALIILFRRPNEQDDPPEINWVFRGYVHGEGHIVGRWKQASTPVGAIGWEGGFMFRKDL